MKTDFPLLIGYMAAIVLASLFGGWLPSAVRMTHTRTHLSMSLVAGLVLGVALYHLVPHALAHMGGGEAVEGVVWWIVLGMVFMVLLLRVLPFHQHDFSGDDPGGGTRSLGWLGITAGMCVCSLVEGVALGTSVRTGGDHAGVVGAGVFLAILLHKPLDALSITSVMQAAGLNRGLQRRVNVGFALVCPAAAALTFWGVGLLGTAQDAVLGRALAFSAGAFLCVSLGDLLPEIHFHSHDRGKLALAFLLGIALAYAMHALESLAMPGG